MPTLDSFESAFKSASKERFRFTPATLSRIMIVTSLQDEAAATFHATLKGAFADVTDVDAIEWLTFDRGSYSSVADLLDHHEAAKPDLICTYRNLYTPGKIFPYSLGTYLDVLTQKVEAPVLVTPRPNLGGVLTQPMHAFKDTLVITDHLTGADRLVSWGVSFTSPTGRLILAHIEDDATFERYAEVFSKIPSIDTDTAREALMKQLLKEPADYIQSCRDLLAEQQLPIAGIDEIVKMGHRVEDFREIITSHEVDLVVFNTKDEDQLAMHGLAFPLAVELRDVPLLML